MGQQATRRAKVRPVGPGLGTALALLGETGEKIQREWSKPRAAQRVELEFASCGLEGLVGAMPDEGRLAARDRHCGRARHEPRRAGRT